jgi:hypothetical protein
VITPGRIKAHRAPHRIHHTCLEVGKPETILLLAGHMLGQLAQDDFRIA